MVRVKFRQEKNLNEQKSWDWDSYIAENPMFQYDIYLQASRCWIFPLAMLVYQPKIQKIHTLKFHHPAGSSKPHPPRHLANLLELRVNISQVLVPSWQKNTYIKTLKKTYTAQKIPKIHMPPPKKRDHFKKKKREKQSIFQALFFSGKSSNTLRFFGA